MNFFRLAFGLIAGAAALIGILFSLFALTILLLPDVGELEGCLTTTMYQVHLCPSGPHYVHLKDMAPEIGQAVVASEDTAFYSHHGFDWYEIEQSFKANMEENHIHRGGSTLTQQLAKNVWLNQERSYWRKAKEAYLTYELEKRFPKQFILEKYLNVVQFGPNLFGVKDASEHYFHKSPAELNLLQAVFLAFVLPNPPVYSRSFDRGQLTPFAKNIINIILKRMVTFKTISPEAYQYAVNEIPSFPWTELTRAEFSSAHIAPATAPDESSKDTQDLDQFLSDDQPDDALDTAPEPKNESQAPAPAPVEPGDELKPDEQLKVDKQNGGPSAEPSKSDTDSNSNSD